MIALSVQLSKRPTAQAWDHISGILYQFHSLGIEEAEEPAPQGESALVTANEFELALEPGVLDPPLYFTAYFENRRDAKNAERAVHSSVETLEPQYKIWEIEEQDYTALYKNNFQPMRVPPYWLVRASWHEDRPSKNEVELLIEPGMAFGTGSHETTKSCLELLAEPEIVEIFKRPSKVLDFGCGSGILAIAMKKLGATEVLGIDIDPLAVMATKQNADANHVEIRTAIEALDISNLDGIVANILKNTLLDFAPRFSGWLKSGGFLVLSGLLADQETIILDAYHKEGFSLRKRLIQGDHDKWVSLYLTKN